MPKLFSKLVPAVLCLLVAAPALALATETAMTPEEEHGCGPDPKDTPDGVAKGFCERYELLKQWYGAEVDHTYGVNGEYKACQEFARASARLRNVMCAYYKEASAFTELSRQYKAQSGGQASQEQGAGKLGAAGKALHEKFRKLLVKNKDEQLVKYLALQDALKAQLNRGPQQVRREAYSCSGGDLSGIPGPWLVSTNYFTTKEAREVEDRFQGKVFEAIKYSGAEATSFAQMENVAGARERGLGQGGEPGKVGYEPPNMATEWWWGIFGDRTSDYGSRVLEKMSWSEATARWAGKYSGPLLGFGIGLAVDYFRFGHVSMGTWLNAFCGLAGLTIGLVCTTVLTLMDMDKARMEAYGRFSSDYLQKVNAKASSQEISGKFCEAIAKEAAAAKVPAK